MVQLGRNKPAEGDEGQDRKGSPNGDVCTANVPIGRELDAVLRHGNDNGVTNAPQVPAGQVASPSSLGPTSDFN